MMSKVAPRAARAQAAACAAHCIDHAGGLLRRSTPTAGCRGSGTCRTRWSGRRHQWSAWDATLCSELTATLVLALRCAVPSRVLPAVNMLAALPQGSRLVAVYQGRLLLLHGSCLVTIPCCALMGVLSVLCAVQTMASCHASIAARPSVSSASSGYLPRRHCRTWWRENSSW